MRAPSRALIWRAANAVMALLFAFGALVQLNDPDPLGWALLYAAAAISCACASLMSARLVWLPLGVGLLALAWAGVLGASLQELAPLPSLFAELEMKSAAIEETRELYGLGLIALWMALNAVVQARAPSRRPSG